MCIFVKHGLNLPERVINLSSEGTLGHE
jgi:hypothetical protein